MWVRAGPPDLSAPFLVVLHSFRFSSPPPPLFRNRRFVVELEHDLGIVGFCPPSKYQCSFPPRFFLRRTPFVRPPGRGTFMVRIQSPPWLFLQLFLTDRNLVLPPSRPSSFHPCPCQRAGALLVDRCAVYFLRDLTFPLPGPAPFPVFFAVGPGVSLLFRPLSFLPAFAVSCGQRRARFARPRLHSSPSPFPLGNRLEFSLFSPPFFFIFLKGLKSFQSLYSIPPLLWFPGRAHFSLSPTKLRLLVWPDGDFFFLSLRGMRFSSWENHPAGPL